MDPRLKILLFLVDVVLPVVAGYGLARYAKVRKVYFDRLMVGNILVLATALAVLTFWVMRLSLQLAWLPVLGVVMQVLPAAIALPIARKRYPGSLEQGSYLLSAMLSNRGVVGMITVFILFGGEGYALNRLVMLLAPFVVYMVCYPMSKYFYGRHNAQGGQRLSLVSILLSRNQVPVIGIAVGLALNYGGIRRPGWVDPVFPWLIHLTSWLFMIPVGASMDLSQMKKHWVQVMDLLPLKFVAVPLVIYILARLVGLSGTVHSTVLIASMSPVAITSVITARLYGLNVHLASAAFALTTAVYLVVVFPLVLLTLGGG